MYPPTLGPRGLSYVPMKFTPQSRRAPSVHLSTVGARRGVFALFAFSPTAVGSGGLFFVLLVMLDAGIAGQIENRSALFLKWLPREDPGEEVAGRRGCARCRRGDGDEAGAAKLAHLEHLAVDVS